MLKEGYDKVPSMENYNAPFQNDDHVNADETTNQKDDLSDNQDENRNFQTCDFD